MGSTVRLLLGTAELDESRSLEEQGVHGGMAQSLQVIWQALAPEHIEVIEDSHGDVFTHSSLTFRHTATGSEVKLEEQRRLVHRGDLVQLSVLTEFLNGEVIQKGDQVFAVYMESERRVNLAVNGSGGSFQKRETRELKLGEHGLQWASDDGQ